MVVGVPLAAFYALILATGAVVGRALLEDSQSIALVYATSVRNLTVALAIAAVPGFPPAEAVLPIALASLIQPPLGAVYMHYRRDVVGQDRGLVEVVRSWGSA